MTPQNPIFRRLRRARQSQTPFSNVSEHVGYFTIAFCHLYDSLKNVKVLKTFYEYCFYFSSDILILWFCLSAISGVPSIKPPPFSKIGSLSRGGLNGIWHNFEDFGQIRSNFARFYPYRKAKFLRAFGAHSPLLYTQNPKIFSRLRRDLALFYS